MPIVQSEITLRGDRVQIESLQDDIRGWPINLSLKSRTIIAPPHHAEASRLGKVVAIGDGRLSDGEQHEFSVKVGDIVLCQRYPASGNAVKWCGKNLFFMSETEILAKIEVTNGKG